MLDLSGANKVDGLVCLREGFVVVVEEVELMVWKVAVVDRNIKGRQKRVCYSITKTLARDRLEGN